MSVDVFDQFVALANQALTPDAINAALKTYFDAKGIKYFSFTYYTMHPRSVNKLKYDFASEAYKHWHRHFVEQHYDEVDSTMEKAYQSTLPTYWNVEAQIASATTPREREMRQDSKDFGIECGLSIPLHGAHEDFANLIVAQKYGETVLADWQNLQHELLVVAHYYYNTIAKLFYDKRESESAYQLTARELQCLTLVGRHLKVEAIAKQLGISERTVNFHIQNSNKKLGVKNKYEAVNKAVDKGVISF